MVYANRNMSLILRKTFLFLLIAVHLLTFRPFGSVVYDIAEKYDGCSVAELRKLEKLTLKRAKADLDITFLQNCKLFRIFPKFITFRISYGNNHDIRAIRKRLLKSALHKRISDKRQLDKQYNSTVSHLKNVLSSMDWFVLNRCVARNVKKSVNQIVRQHAKKMSNLTHNTELPFSANDVISNISSRKLSSSEEDALKSGLKHGLPPPKLSKTDVFVTFEKIYNFFSTNLKEGANDSELKTNLTHLAHKYVSSYQPSKQVLRKHAILKKLRNNPDIVITKPDKGNGVVIMDAVDYNKRMMEMISDPTKFEKRNRYCGVNAKDITIYREEQL